MEALELWDVGIAMGMFFVAMLTVIVAGIGIIITTVQKDRGLRDEEFERDMARLKSLSESLKISRKDKILGKKDKSKDDILFVLSYIESVEFNIDSLLDVKGTFDFVTTFNPFADYEHYFCLLEI